MTSTPDVSACFASQAYRVAPENRSRCVSCIKFRSRGCRVLLSLINRPDQPTMWKAVFLFGVLLVACCAAGLLGGYEDVDVDDEGVVTAANHASKALSKQFAGKYHHRLSKVLKAKQQVVAGMNYRMDIVVGMTTCKKDEVEYEQLGDCDFQDGISTYKKCTVVVYRDLKDNHKLVTSGCILASKKDL